MTTKIVLQGVILGCMILNTLLELKFAVDGRMARNPSGFGGIIVALGMAVVVFGLYYWAGVFDELFS